MPFKYTTCSATPGFPGPQTRFDTEALVAVGGVGGGGSAGGDGDGGGGGGDVHGGLDDFVVGVEDSWELAPNNLVRFRRGRGRRWEDVPGGALQVESS